MPRIKSKLTPDPRLYHPVVYTRQWIKWRHRPKDLNRDVLVLVSFGKSKDNPKHAFATNIGVALKTKIFKVHAWMDLPSDPYEATK